MRKMTKLLLSVSKICNEFNLVNPITFMNATDVFDKNVRALVYKYKDSNEKYNIIYDDGTIKGRYTVVE